MKVLITGATGMIGQRIASTLLADETITICLMSRGPQKQDDLRLTHCMGDLLDTDSLLAATKDIDVVLHLAAVTHSHSSKRYDQVNARGSKNLLEACETNGVKRFILISSTAANPDGGAYARSKYLAEQHVQRFRQQWLILRLSEVYGAGEREAVSTLIRTIKKGVVVPIPGKGDQELAPVAVDDAVGAIVTALKAGISHESLVIAGPEVMTYRQLVQSIEEAYGVRRTKICVPVPLLKCIAFISWLLNLKLLYRDQIPRLFCKKNYDIGPTRTRLGFSPRDMKTVLALMKDYG